MLRRVRRAVLVPVAVMLVAVSAAPALAGPPTDRVRDFFADVNRVIADPAYDDRPMDRLPALRTLVAEIVDFRNAAAVSLGSEWAARAPAEREEFVRLFTDLLQSSIVGSVGSRARLDNGVAVTYIGELGDGGGVTVATSVLTRSGGEMGVGYRMTSRRGRWLVHDVVVDGVSLVDNYRAQFHKVIQRSGYAALVSEMRTRIADLHRPAAPPAGAIVTAGALVVADPAPREPVHREPIHSEPLQRESLPTPPIAAPSPLAVVAAAPADPPAAVQAPAEPARASEPAVVMTARPVETPVRIAAVSPARPAPPKVARLTSYWVQVGAFRSVEKAMDTTTALRDQAVSLITAPGQLLRVLVGPFRDRGAATSKLRELRTRGYEAFIAEATN